MVKRVELARELGCARSRVTQLAAAGMPVEADGTVDRDRALAWIAQRPEGGGWGGRGSGRQSLAARAQGLLAAEKAAKEIPARAPGMKEEDGMGTITVGEAAAALDALKVRRADLVGRREKLVARMDNATKGKRYLEDPDGAIAELATERAEIDAIEYALGVLDEREAAAEIAVKAATARDLRRQAASKLRDAERIAAKTLPLLADLSKVEGVAFTRCIVHSQRAGVWLACAGACGPFAGADVDELAPGEVAPDVGNSVLFAMPLSRRLRMEAAELVGRAAVMEREIGADAPTDDTWTETEGAALSSAPPAEFVEDASATRAIKRVPGSQQWTGIEESQSMEPLGRPDHMDKADGPGWTPAA